MSRGQRSMRFEHFTIFADADVGQELVRLAGEDLEAALRGAGAAARRALATPQVVVLYSGRSYFSLASVPDWVSGLYDGKIRVSVEAEAAGAGLLAGRCSRTSSRTR